MRLVKLTPETLIEAPRRSPAVPNSDGSKALYWCSRHTIGKDTLKELRVLDLHTGDTERLSGDPQIQDAQWLGSSTQEVIYLNSGERGKTQIVVVDISKPDTHHVIEDVNAIVSTLKTKSLDDGSVVFLVAGMFDPGNGKLVNEGEHQPKSSIRSYDTYRVKTFSGNVPLQSYHLWYSRLEKTADSWRLAYPLRDTISEANIQAPVGMGDPFENPSGSFDISSNCLVYVGEDLHDGPEHAGTNFLFHVGVNFMTGKRAYAGRKVHIPGHETRGRYTNPRFSPSGDAIAFIIAPSERSADRRLYQQLVEKDGRLSTVPKEVIWKNIWDRVPESFELAATGFDFLITAEDQGHKRLFQYEPFKHDIPRPLFEIGSVAECKPFATQAGSFAIVTWSSLTDRPTYQVYDLNGFHEPREVTPHDGGDPKLDIARLQVSELCISGDDERRIHAWMIKPSDFDEKKTYPLALLVHGGPQMSWDDEWSTRWNPLVWAEQGYICVLPNVTGSLGYGLELEERLYGHWGLRPYRDLAKCFEHLQSLPYIDAGNAILAGASYGGYMANFIQGMPLGCHLKAIVSHAGPFSLHPFFLNTDVIEGDETFRGPPYIWEKHDLLQESDPTTPERFSAWQTPMLVLHGQLDNRVPVTEGLAAFRACQVKGVPSRFVLFPDEHHLILKEENSLAWHREVFSWINHYTGIQKWNDEIKQGDDKMYRLAPRVIQSRQF